MIVPVAVTLPSGVAVGWLVPVSVGVTPDVVVTRGVIVPAEPGVAPGAIVPVDPAAGAAVIWTSAAWAEAAWAEAALGVWAEARTANINESTAAQIAKMKTRYFISN